MKVNQRKVGVILSYLAQIIHILTGLIYTPIMLRLLGQSEYGLYTLVQSVVSYLGLLSLGFSASYVRFYSRYKAADDEDGVARLNGIFMTIFTIIAIITLLCGVVMVGNIRNIFGSGLTESELGTARVLMIFMVVNLAMTFPTSVFDSNVTAHEEFVFQKVVTVCQYLFSPFLTLPLLLLGYGSVAVVLITTILTLLKFVVNILFCFKKLHIHFIFRGFKFSLLKEMWVFTFFIFLNQIINQVNWSIDKFLLGRIIGTTEVAVYGLASTINSMYVQFSTAVSSVFVPRVNKIVAEKDDNKLLTELFTKVGRIQFILLGMVITGFIFFGRPFMNWWGGRGYENSYIITLWLIIPVTIPLIQNLGIEIQNAKNMHKVRSVVYFIIAIGNIFMSIPLIKMFGGVGAAIGTAIALFIGNGLFMNWYYHNRIALDIKYYWRQISGFIPGLIIPCIFGSLVMLCSKIEGIKSLLIWIPLYVFVYCISMWFLGFNDYEKDLIKPIIRKVIQKSR